MLVKEIMTTKPVVLDIRNATVSDAMDRMRDVDIHQIPAVNGKKYVGMLNYREIMRRRSLQLSAKAENYVISSPSVSPEDDVTAVIRLIVDTGLSAFPVIKDRKLVGIISRSDVIQNLEKVIGARDLRNIDVMSTEPVYVHEDDSIDEASVKMRGLDETEIPVIDQYDRLSGILRLDEIAVNTFKRQKSSIRGTGDPSGARVGEKLKVVITCASLMDTPSHIRAQDSFVESARLLTERRLHILPVVDDEMKILGIVGISDIIDAIDEREKEGMLVVVSGLEPGDREIYDITFAMASKFLNRFSNITGITHGKLNIHVTRYNTEGREKYSVRTKIIAEPLVIGINHHDWNYGKCLSFIFDTYEPRLRKWKTKQGHELI